MEWKTVKLGEVLTIKYGKDHKALGAGNIPVYGSGGIMRYADKAIYEKPSILIPRKGSLNNIFYVDKPFWTVDTMFWSIIDTKKADPHFLFYAICKLDFAGLNVGSAVPSLTVPVIEAVELPLPPLETQRRIAAILSSLDDKIENNNRINRNLEAQAQALFKSWFVDFEPWGGSMPEDWKEVSLNEMTSKFGTGLNPRKNFKLGEGENYYVTIKNMGNNRVYLDDRCDKVTDEAIEKINKRSKLQAGDLLFSGIGTIGRVALVTETPTNWNTSESVFNLHPANNISSEFLYVLLLSDVFQNYVKVHAQGGVQQGIRMASLKDYKMYIPEDSKMKQFDSLIIPIITRIKNIDKENDRLADLRNTLLPKLMKGEITL